MTELVFDGLSFYALEFVGKFIIQNKESLEKLILKNVQVERGGEEMLTKFGNKIHKIDLKVVHIENVNLSDLGIKRIII